LSVSPPPSPSRSILLPDGAANIGVNAPDLFGFTRMLARDTMMVRHSRLDR
jgi:hypothetical protein